MRLIRDERGVTTVGMAVALFVSIALIFSGAQLYRAHSAAAEVQEVADVCALAADDEVAGLEIVANACDGVCLSLALLSVTLQGLGLVAACVPPAEGVSVKLIEWGRKAAESRDRFYERACQGLNAAQRVLPFLAMSHAMETAKANDGTGTLEAEHLAAAVLVPQSFTELGAAADDGLAEATNAVNGEAQAIRDAAREAEEAAEQANAAKERGFMEDCGADPAYCMRERAASLAGLSGADNPAYASVDAWSFEVGLERARAYYRARLGGWRLEGRSVEEQANSVIRKRFYQYALDELADAFVQDGPDGFSAYLPHLFRNTDEMRRTSLYTEAVYPVTVEDGVEMMHAWSGCPQAAGSGRSGSLSEWEAARGTFVKCPSCEFTASGVGSVAAASTSIKNGFENHYEQMRQACEDHRAARAVLDPLAAEVKAKVTPLLDSLGAVLGNAQGHRIHLEPPGRDGVLALVVNTAQSAADTGFESRFVAGGATLGVRAAVSAAILVEDGTESAGALVTEAVSGLLPSAGGVGAAASVAVGAWTALLRAYEDGQTALQEAVERGLGSFSQNSASGIGRWAADALAAIISAAGLKPADTACRKPCVLNTRHVAVASDDAVCVRFLEAKDAALRGSQPSTSFVDALLGAVASGSNGDPEAAGEGMSIAEVALPFGGSTLIRWLVPGSSADAGDFLEQAREAAAAAVVGVLGDRSWQ